MLSVKGSKLTLFLTGIKKAGVNYLKSFHTCFTAFIGSKKCRFPGISGFTGSNLGHLSGIMGYAGRKKWHLSRMRANAGSKFFS